jgi:hypothetical protein
MERRMSVAPHRMVGVSGQRKPLKKPLSALFSEKAGRKSGPSFFRCSISSSLQEKTPGDVFLKQNCHPPGYSYEI